MSESPKDEDQKKGDDVLRRLLKTPPKRHEPKQPKKEDLDSDDKEPEKSARRPS